MRLDDPHPASFTYFACRLREDEELCEADPDLLISRHAFTSSGADAVLSHIRDTIDSREALYRQVAEIEARSRGLDVSLPGAQWLIEGYASTSAALDLKTRTVPGRPERLRDGGWRPRRSTAKAVAFEAWLAAGAVSYPLAADLLNTHRPASEEVDRYDIIRAVDSEIAQLAFLRGPYRDRPADLYRAIATAGIAEHRAMMTLWRRLHREKGNRRINLHWQVLRRDGQLFAMKAACQEAALAKSGVFLDEVEKMVGVIRQHVYEHLLKLGRKRGLFETAPELAGATHTAAR